MKKVNFIAVFFVTTLSFALNFDSCYAKKKSVKNNRRIKKTEIVINTPPKQSIVIDFDSGEIISQVNADERCAPSSMTKLMTTYLAFEALVEGRLHLEDELPVSEKAKNQEGSRSFFEAGSLATVENLIRSIIIHSGNDACVVIAEKLAGDEEAFADLMNQKAEQFGLKNTHFKNSTGLPDEDHYSSMRDLAIIAKHIISDFPEYYHYFAEKTFTVNGITQHNRNTLIGNSLNIDGLKTGHTNAGGYGIVISGMKDGKRLIAIVNGCKSEKSRAIEANKILAMGFNEYIPVKIATNDAPISTAKVEFGKRDKVNLYTGENITVLIPKKYRSSLVVNLNIKEPIPAPIFSNTKIGTLNYRYGNYSSKAYDLYIHEPVEKMNLLEIIITKIKSLFSNKESGAEAPGLKVPMKTH